MAIGLNGLKFQLTMLTYGQISIAVFSGTHVILNASQGEKAYFV
jgi:hypothetical protein